MHVGGYSLAHARMMYARAWVLYAIIRTKVQKSPTKSKFFRVLFCPCMPKYRFVVIIFACHVKNSHLCRIKGRSNQKMQNNEFEIFVQRSRNGMIATARRYGVSLAEAEDIVQDALVRLYAMRHRLDEYRRVESLANVVVRNMTIDLLRKRNRYVEVALNADLQSEEDIGSDERIKPLLRAIEELPSKQQLVLRMKHIEELEVEEIASLLGMNIEAVYQNLSRARRAILKQFKTATP